MNIAIVGFDTEGKSSFEYFSQPEDDGTVHDITVLDQNTNLEVPAGTASVLGKDYLHNLNRFDVVVRTAGLSPHKILEANPNLPHSKITTQINEFFKASPTTNIIGVTGTKGKGTTSTLITKMLEAAGKDVHLGGNIGIPALDLLPKLSEKSWVVLELSSFQLIDLKCSPAIAICLMVVPEHLNWHADMAEYVTAKQQLFVWQTYDDVAIYFKGNEYATTVAAAGNGAKVPYFAPPGAIINDGAISIGGQVICHTSELKLLGEHNWQNACAAITAAWQITHSVSALRSVLTSFAGLPHRLELVREVAGVKYYNDSFAATPDSAMAAIEAIKDNKVMIIGGFDRDLPIDHFAASLKANEKGIRKALIIGASAQRLAAECDKAGFTNYEILTVQTMPEIVAAAQQRASNGDSVLLSPGFASFDMFKNFEDRGNQYKKAVNEL